TIRSGKRKSSRRRKRPRRSWPISWRAGGVSDRGLRNGVSMLIHARHYATEQPVAVAIDSGRIVSIDPSPQTPTQWIAPSFFDPQINGCLGIAFNSPDLLPEQVRTVAEECRKHGIGGFCPTLITGSF